MYDHLIDIDNYPGVQPFGIGKTWRHLFAKCVLKITGPESTTVCQGDHICAVLKAGIDGAVHRVQDIWDDNFSTDNWVFLIVGTEKDFNEIKKIGMLWTVCHVWPSVARFVFNCYRQWSSIVLLNWNGTARLKQSR